MPVTRGNIVSAVATKLHDAGMGDFSQVELRSAADDAILQTVIAARTYKEAVSNTVVAPTHTYSAEPCFEILLISLGGQALDKLEDTAAAQAEWDGAVAGVPRAWRQLTGASYQVSPTPSVGAAGMIGAINPTPTVGGTGYQVGEILSVTTGGTGGKVKVASVSAGVVTGLELVMGDRSQRGTGYTTGTGKATTADTGSGSGCTVYITALAKLEVVGYSVIGVPVDDNTTITAIPEAYVKPAIVPLAMSFALENRRTGPANLPLAERKRQEWIEWAARLSGSLRPKL